MDYSYIHYDSLLNQTVKVGAYIKKRLVIIVLYSVIAIDEWI